MKTIQKTFTYKQINDGAPKEVFPLLCPVREKDWLDGWDYKMIYSKSGLVEKDCVFLTPHHGKADTIWYVSQYDPKNFTVEFIRVTPNESVVKISISLSPADGNKTEANISYQYTGLNEEQNNFIESELEEQFIENMKWWEKAINHYLKTDEKLFKKE
ncbi:MAG: hypothetical protein JSW63_12395 [Ignavibacterium sp.]|nr:MAG: hypothetical protein JSW63_12395 [Ignavibacterium sp.]